MTKILKPISSTMVLKEEKNSRSTTMMKFHLHLVTNDDDPFEIPLQLRLPMIVDLNHLHLEARRTRRRLLLEDLRGLPLGRQ